MFAIVCSNFYPQISKNLLKGCIKVFEENNIEQKSWKVIEVPGAFEIPLACQKLAKTKKYKVIIALGCVIKGQTGHYEMVCKACVEGIMKIMLNFEIPIIFEVLMVNDILHAEERAQTRDWSKNKGYIGGKMALEIHNL